MSAHLGCYYGIHRIAAWHATEEGACSQVPFADGYKCVFCKRLLMLYNQRDDLIRLKNPIIAPEPKPAIEVYYGRG